MIPYFLPLMFLVSLLSQVPIAVDHSPCFPDPPNLPAELPCKGADSCPAFPIPKPLPLCPLETKGPSTTEPLSTDTSSTTTVSTPKRSTPPIETTVFSSENTVTLSTVAPETTLLSPEAAESSSEAHQVRRRNRIVKRQAGRVGRVNWAGCPNYLLGRIIGHVVGPMTSSTRLRLGDIAQVLQQTLQRATGRSFEVILGKGNMMFASYQTSEYSFCRLRIGEYYTAVYETPVQYDTTDLENEKILSNIDFGERLGGSGYPAQAPFPYRVYSPLENLLEGAGLFTERQCFSGDLIVETRDGPKRMSELKTGDEVMSVEEGMGMITFSPILMFLHRDEQLLAQFVVITTATGNSVKLTSEHLIYIYDCEQILTLRPVRAKEVSTSHCIISTHSSLTTLEADQIVNVSKITERGIYSPLTSTGDIIVNGVLASCHSNLAFKTLQQSLFNVYRFFYRFFSFILPEEGPLPIGLSSLLRSLDLFIPEKPTY